MVRTSSGFEAAVVRRDQTAVDQPGARLGVGEGGDDGELVGVGDDHALVRVVVVRRAAQHRGALLDPHDAGEGVLLAGQIADDGDPVADHRGLAAQFAGLHRHDRTVRRRGR